MRRSIHVVMFILLLSQTCGCADHDLAKMATIDDVGSKRIGVHTGTLFDKFAVKRFPSAAVMPFNNPSDFTLALKNGKIDAVITNLQQARVLVQENDDIGILTEDVLSLPIGVGFNKKDVALRERFNAFLKAIKADGSFDAMYKKWFETDINTVGMPAFERKATGNHLVLGVSVGDLPSVGFVDGEYVGFDVEMIKTFAQKENIDLEVISLEFGALIASLKTGKVDMIADCMVITEERQKEVAFSDPYMEDKSAIIALKKNIAHLEQKGKIEESSLFASFTEGFHNNIVREKRYVLILAGLKTTIIISVLSILFGTMLGALICFMRMSSYRAINAFARTYISLVRGIPVLVLLMIIYYVVFAKSNIDPLLVAVIAFAMNFAAYVSEMFRTSIEGIDKGQTEAGIAGGFSRVQTFVYVVMPQAIKQVLPVYKGELISLVKMTSIVGYIAVQDLTKASDIIRSRTFDAFFPLLMTAALYFAISWSLLLLLGFVERRTDPKQRRRALVMRPRPLRLPAAAALSACAAGVLLLSGLHGGFFGRMADDGKIAGEGHIARLSDLDGKRICVITGTTGDFVVREKYKSAHIVDMLYAVDAALAVKANKADAFVFDRPTLEYFAARNKNDLELLPEKLSTVDIVIPMRLSDKALHNNINSALGRLRDDGTLDVMYNKWFLEQQISIPDIESSGKNGTLRMGTCSLVEPFAFVSNGKLVGFDIELACRIAHLLEVKLEITDMTFDAMIAALQAEKIDIAIANYYKVEEPRKTCEFSIPYMHIDLSVLVRRAKP